MGTTVRISLEEYMNTSYRPDVEFIDGELREKPLGKIPHGRAQGLLIVWFWQHQEEWRIYTGSEIRTQTSANRVRLPDVVAFSADVHDRGALTTPPLVAVEVLSPTDTPRELADRATDLERMGTETIWLIDEDARTISIWRENEWHRQDSTRVQAVRSPIYLDMEWLWQQLDKRF